MTERSGAITQISRECGSLQLLKTVMSLKIHTKHKYKNELSIHSLLPILFRVSGAYPNFLGATFGVS